MKKEIRYNITNLKLRDSEDDLDSRTIEGTAIVFNRESELISENGIVFREIILPQAVTPELINKSDIVMLYNHKKDAGVLARSKNGTGTLNINITNSGVDFSFEAPKSALGDQVLESVKRKDLDACSFAFVPDKEVLSRNNNNNYITINSFKSLGDFSIVVNPAYKATSVSARGLKEFIENEEAEKLRLAAEEAEKLRLETEEAEKVRLSEENKLIERKLYIENYYDNLYKL